MQAKLINLTNSDVTVVNAARTSFAKEVGEISDKDIKLLNYLATHAHWTPFSHCRETFLMNVDCINPFTFKPEDLAGMVWDKKGIHVKIRHSIWGWANLIKKNLIPQQVAIPIANTLVALYPHSSHAMGLRTVVIESKTWTDFFCKHKTDDETDPHFIDYTVRETIPIFIARQRFKHVIGFTYNEVSRRYVDDTPEFFTPDVWRSRPEGSVKQGSGEDEITKLHDFYGSTRNISTCYGDFLDQAKELYNKMLESNVAPEQARMVLPQSMYTSYYVTGSLAAWQRAYDQRIAAHAQKEIQDLAQQWKEVIPGIEK